MSESESEDVKMMVMVMVKMMISEIEREYVCVGERNRFRVYESEIEKCSETKRQTKRSRPEHSLYK